MMLDRAKFMRLLCVALVAVLMMPLAGRYFLMSVTN